MQQQPADFSLAFSAAVAEVRHQNYALVDPHDTELVRSDGRLRSEPHLMAAGVLELHEQSAARPGGAGR